MVCPRGGGIFSFYLGFRKKTGPMYMGHYHIFFSTTGLMPHTCFEVGFCVILLYVSEVLLSFRVTVA